MNKPAVNMIVQRTFLGSLRHLVFEKTAIDPLPERSTGAAALSLWGVWGAPAPINAIKA
jgi:hypothetical protein